ncbi:MBL fold metallo-hydrolase [uncultured Cocleimonas sp.]|uniref:MBL fold metallo-hydrolase n=1 Tax=uncultured Cocleimonas sp. TaxID=1051587 RepID=UPI002613FBAD|nr:MBL fold metallo-hydrolase [uncultured Cocleimonas sp.]
MRKFSILITLCSLLFLINASSALADFTLAMKAKQVAPDVYAIETPSRALPNPENQGWNSNAAFVVTDSGVILFDTGSSFFIGFAMKKAIAQVTDQPVRWIINSHAHGDHWLGNAAFKDSVKDIYATEQVAKNIKSEGKNWVDNFNTLTKGATGESEILAPKTFITERTKIKLGDKEITLFLSGDSHSPGDILMWLANEKVLVTGDVIYSDRMPSTFDSNIPQWIKLLGELEGMKPNVVVPGHGVVTDKQGVTRLKNLLQTFWSAVEAGYEEDKSAYEMAPEVIVAMSEFKSHYPGLEEKVQRDISKVYLQVEAASF